MSCVKSDLKNFSPPSRCVSLICFAASINRSKALLPFLWSYALRACSSSTAASKYASSGVLAGVLFIFFHFLIEEILAEFILLFEGFAVQPVSERLAFGKAKRL